MSGKRILYINPGEKDEVLDNQVRDFLLPYKSPLTAEIDVVSMPQTPQHLEYHAYHALIAPEILREVVRGEQAGYDGCILGCFDDPCLDAAREVCRRMVVTGACEASVHLAATLSHRFSVIVGRPAWETRMRPRVLEYVAPQRLASFRSVGLGVLEFQADPARTQELIRQAVLAAVSQDHAEAIVLGCTMEFGFFKQLQAECGVPVIDACLAPLKYLEYLLNVKEQCGWSASKAGAWASPPSGELAAWGLTEKFGFSL